MLVQANQRRMFPMLWYDFFYNVRMLGLDLHVTILLYAYLVCLRMGSMLTSCLPCVLRRGRVELETLHSTSCPQFRSAIMELDSL